jgi:truncated hemoglobin YjbI
MPPIAAPKYLMNRPSIFEAAGGAPAFEALTSRFYRKVKADLLLSPVFASFTSARETTRSRIL